MKCNCKKHWIELKEKTPDGIEYRYYRCEKCGEEIVDIEQLENIAREYKNFLERVEKAWKKYKEGKFKSCTKEEFLRKLKKL